MGFHQHLFYPIHAFDILKTKSLFEVIKKVPTYCTSALPALPVHSSGYLPAIPADIAFFLGAAVVFPSGVFSGLCHSG